MIPLRDTIESRTLPVVNYALIAINVVVFLQTRFAPPHFYQVYGLVPARYISMEAWNHFGLWHQLFALFSFMFLHGGWMHILGNMLSLYIFGDNVEDRLGHLGYLLFYLTGGLASGITHLLFNASSTTPTIGASGAVAAVMGAYFLLYPKAKVLTLIPIVFIPLFFEIPAFIYLGLWFVMQFLNATGASTSHIAWWAHIGGFLFGMGWIFLSGREAPTRRFQATRRRTHKLQLVHVEVANGGFNLTGHISITSRESKRGTLKMINVAQFGRGRLLKVTIPPGLSSGKQLRLKGLGLPHPDGYRGDLLLTVHIR
ncbi:MAG: rhomboid family intramembrane serine protease [Desulfobacterales bacterium]|nr:rhomboid family intramembrane serine protease [Desulfobacterales bacterium]